LTGLAGSASLEAGCAEANALHALGVAELAHALITTVSLFAEGAVDLSIGAEHPYGYAGRDLWRR